jgi:hypothetical protein
MHLRAVPYSQERIAESLRIQNGKIKPKPGQKINSEVEKS